MTYNYAPITATASRLITRFGADHTFSRTSGGAYNPATGTVTESNAYGLSNGDEYLLSDGSQYVLYSPTGGLQTLTWSGKGVYQDYSDSEIDGTTILRGDRRLIIEALNIVRAPEVGDKISGTSEQILNVQTIRPGSTVVAYVCQVRG